MSNIKRKIFQSKELLFKRLFGLNLPTVLLFKPEDLIEMSKEKNNVYTGNNNLNLITDQSDYFNYGFNIAKWKEKTNKFRAYIKNLVEKNKIKNESSVNLLNVNGNVNVNSDVKFESEENDKCLKYMKENLLRTINYNNINEEEYLKKLPADFGGLGKKLENNDNLNFFAYNCINFSDKANIPHVLYRKENFLIELPNTNKTKQLTEDDKKHLIELIRSPDVHDKKNEENEGDVILINSDNIKNLSSLKNSNNISAKLDKIHEETRKNNKSNYFSKGKNNIEKASSVTGTSSVSSVTSRDSKLNGKKSKIIIYFRWK